MKSDALAILMPVWHGYRALVPLSLSLLDKYWPGHPPVILGGLTAEEAGTANHVPVSDPARRGNWSWMVRDAASQVAARGFTHVYLIAEEHVPLGPCNVPALEKTLPQWLEDLDAVYISLMGWDNRRYPSKSSLLPADHGRMMHLTRAGDPRFHLHPALWRLDVLLRCCELALRDPAKNGSAWHFEKVNDKSAADLDPAWKAGCYQIAARELSLKSPTPLGAASARVERFVFNKLMALYPFIRPQSLANSLSHLARFDDVFCDGPYPMFYSGLMVKGGENPYAASFLERTADGRDILRRLRELMPPKA